MKSFVNGYLENAVIPLELTSDLRALGEFKGKQDLFGKQTPQVLETLRHIAMIQSTESSNRIEGITVDVKRLEPLIDKKTTPKDRPEAEVVGYRNVLAKIHASSDSFEINPETILQMHKEMLKGTNLPSGEWKRRDNTIEEKQSDGTWKTRFEPVTAVQTPYFMKTLCDEFNREWNKERADRIILILSFVLDFLCIHPFTDGNGRISRLLTVLLLHKSGYDVGRYISLEKLIEDSKETYYEILRDCSMGWHEGKHRILPWWRYSIGILISAYKEFMSRAGDVGSARGAKTDWIMEAIDNLGNSFTLAQIMKVCPGVSRPMIRVVVEKLRKKGVLKTLGTGRNAKWQKNVIISDKRDNKRDNKKKKPKK